MDSVQQQQLALDGSGDQGRRPPRRVSVGEGEPLLEKVPGRHVLEVGEEEGSGNEEMQS